MRTLLHLSDLHFGRIDERLLTPLVKAATQIQPDLVVVSGDLTQRARASQFRAAKAFTDLLPFPQIIVPGNHDVPMHNPIARFLYPLAEYRRSFSDNPEPFFQDDELAVLGLNSSRAFTIQDGRLNERQIKRMIDVFRAAPSSATKIVVCHHPFSLPPGNASHRVVGGADRVLAAMAACGADMVLSGHLHTTYVSFAARLEGETGWSVLLSQAGTATSSRLRGQEASFNLLRIHSQKIEFESYDWARDEDQFTQTSTKSFKRDIGGWSAWAGAS